MRLPHLHTAAVLGGALWAAAWLAVPAALAQTPAAAPVTPAGATAAPSAGTGARYVESCRQALERGVAQPGCQGPLYASELARLKEDALRTHNPSLLTLLGDAYQSNRTGISDIGQAYRWYLLAAVRGDPRAMQRLSDMYRSGQGAPGDNVKALGYARLAQQLAIPGSTEAKQASEAVAALGSHMAQEERALADRFAGELAQDLRRAQAPGTEAAAGAPAAPAPALTGRLPGLGAAQSPSPSPEAAPPPQPARPVPAPPIGLPGSAGAAQPPALSQ